MSSYRMKYKIGATQYHIPVVDDMAGFGSGIPLGTILPYSANSQYPPEGFLWCDGSAVSRAAYPDLFALIGTLYGEGDGSTTFNLPDLRGRVAQGASNTNPVGTYKEAGLPNIEGTFMADSAIGSVVSLNSVSGAFTTGTQYKTSAIAYRSTTSYDLKFDASLENSVYGNSDTVQPPAACVNYIIKAFSATSSNSELVDVTELSADIAKKLYKDEPYTDNFAIIYPNNGTASSPASVAANTRYVMDNPFPGYLVACIAEVKFSTNEWGNSGWNTHVSGSTWSAYGTRANQIDNDKIVIRTGVDGAYGYTRASGSPSSADTYSSSAPCRVKVWKVGKLPQS